MKKRFYSGKAILDTTSFSAFSIVLDFFIIENLQEPDFLSKQRTPPPVSAGDIFNIIVNRSVS